MNSSEEKGDKITVISVACDEYSRDQHAGRQGGESSELICWIKQINQRGGKRAIPPIGAGGPKIVGRHKKTELMFQLIVGCFPVSCAHVYK